MQFPFHLVRVDKIDRDDVTADGRQRGVDPDGASRLQAARQGPVHGLGAVLADQAQLHDHLGHGCTGKLPDDLVQHQVGQARPQSDLGHQRDLRGAGLGRQSFQRPQDRDTGRHRDHGNPVIDAGARPATMIRARGKEACSLATMCRPTAP